MELYLLACERVENGGGIYRYDFAEGNLRQTGYFPCDRPMYAVKKGNCLHLLLRAPFEGSEISGYTTLTDFSTLSELVPTSGVCACHLAVEDDAAYFVNYLSGNVVKSDGSCVCHTGNGPHKTRQTAPHTHFTTVTPDKKFVLVTDLGLDTVFTYDRDLRFIDKAKVPEGYGVRHLVFSKDGKTVFAVNELVPSVSAFWYEDGRLTYRYTVDIPCKVKDSTAAAIRLSDDGKYLFVSVRGENSLHSFEMKENGLQEICRTHSDGDFPRDIELIDDKYLVVCNERSPYASVFGVQNGKITEVLDRTEIPACLNCVK